MCFNFVCRVLNMKYCISLYFPQNLINNHLSFVFEHNSLFLDVRFMSFFQVRNFKLQYFTMYCHIYRFRLRKKTWKNPGTVFLDYHIYEEDINISSNWEVFLEVLDGITNIFVGKYQLEML